MNIIGIAIAISLVMVLGAKGVLTIFVGIPLILLLGLFILGAILVFIEQRRMK